MYFTQNSSMFFSLAEIFVGKKNFCSGVQLISINLFNLTCTVKTYRIIYSSCLLGSLIYHLAFYAVCARIKLQQWLKRLKTNGCLSSKGSWGVQEESGKRWAIFDLTLQRHRQLHKRRVVGKMTTLTLS